MSRWPTSHSVSVECQNCGISFPRYQSQILLGRGRFCSRKCLGDWRSKVFRGLISDPRIASGYNFAEHAQPIRRSGHPTPEARRLQSERTREAYASGRRVPWNKGMHYRNPKLSETRKRLFAEGKIKFVPWNKGRHYSEELKQKLSIAQKGKHTANLSREDAERFLAEYEKGTLRFEEFAKSVHHKPHTLRKVFLKHFPDRFKKATVMKKAHALATQRTAYTRPELAMHKILTDLKIPFRSQEPIYVPGKAYPYVLDFLVLNTLAIEVDGVYWHSKQSQREKDAIKDVNLSDLGFRVVKFTDREVLRYPDFVSAIVQAYWSLSKLCGRRLN